MLASLATASLATVSLANDSSGRQIGHFGERSERYKID
jgi:hypothetical protein